MGEHVTAVQRMMTEAIDKKIALADLELVDAAHALVTELARPDSLLKLLTELASGTSDTAACARRSYRHVLGFDKLLLIDSSPRQALRIHLWHPARGSTDQENIHNHRAPLASCVLRGRLNMDLYERTENTGLNTFAYQETLSEPHSDWLLVPQGPAHLRLVHTAHYTAGASYALPAHTLHRAWCDTPEPTITLYLETGTEHHVPTDVFSTSATRSTTVQKVAFTEEEYLAELAAVADVLGSA